MQDNASVYTDLKSQGYSSTCITPTSVFPPKDPLSPASLLASDPPYVTRQDLINNHAICCTFLCNATVEINALRRENAALRSLNCELNHQLSYLLQSTVKTNSISPDFDTTPLDIIKAFQSKCRIGSRVREELVEGDSPTTSDVDVHNCDIDRVLLPKSISVRSTGYLKLKRADAPSKCDGVPRPKIASPPDESEAQKVFVPGGKKEQEPLELQVYNQGMSKTELCNKWQETGACPYGGHCQFAHGIDELRPVIRHPRYKTEVCRMVLAGEICPYGHRCHFRHALSEHEKH